ncbi:MAG: lysophospholipid acyltransferase family protein [Bdellovibrionota bacterium]
MKSIFFFSLKIVLFVFCCIVLSLVWPIILLFCKHDISNKIYARCLHYIYKYGLFAKLEYINLEKLDENKNYIYVANHQSYFDAVLCGLMIPKNCYSIAKDSLIFVPYFGLMYYLAGNFYIKRGHSEKAKKTLEEVIRKIKLKKCSIFILPQGTRSAGNEIAKLKRGFIRLAKDTETDILPFVISTYKISDILYHFRNKNPIYAKVCDKIDYRKPDDEILSELQIVMSNTIKELDALSEK